MEKLQNAIVINNIKYEENDAIITLYCQDNTRIALYANGIQKALSKNRKYLNIGSVIEVEYFPSRGISRMGKLKTAYANEVFQISSKPVEREIDYLFSILKQIDFSEAKISIWEQSLRYLHAAKNGFIRTETRIRFLYEIYKLLGLELELGKCVVCKTTKNLYTLSVSEGGLLCKDHIQESMQVFDKNTLLQTILFLKLDFDEIDSVSFSKEVNDILYFSFEDMVSNIYGISLKKIY